MKKPVPYKIRKLRSELSRAREDVIGEATYFLAATNVREFVEPPTDANYEYHIQRVLAVTREMIRIRNKLWDTEFTYYGQ